MCSKIKLIYQNKKTLREIQVRRVSASEYVVHESGEKMTAYQLKQSYKFMREKSKMINVNFTTGKSPSLSRSQVGKFRVSRAREHRIVDNGNGPSFRKPWEVFWGDELVEGNFPSQADAIRFIKEKAIS